MSYDPKAPNRSMEGRARGWVYRGDAVTTRTRKTSERRPQRSRYVKVQAGLLADLFNGEWEFVDPGADPAGATRFSAVDLFSGCGGMSLGMQWAGFDSVAAVEVDKDAAATYRRNFPSANVWNGRIGDIQDSDVPSLVGTRAIDVLLGGCPCQGFSIAGRRDPEDPRNALFWETIRFARLLRPQFVVLENVPGIITMQGGQVLELIRSEFSAIGYPDMTVLILEAADYGVPQYRPRAIFVANRLGVKNPYPNAVVTPEDHRSIESAIEDLAVVQRDLATNHDWTHHSPQMVERLSKVEPGGSLYDSYTDAWKRQYTGVPSMTIKENHGGSHIHYHLDRTLSAREMARLQSFPDSFFFEGRMKRAMFQIGNAVPPVLAKHIGLAVRTRLRQPEDQEVV